MSKVSIIIPSRNELFIKQTVEGLCKSAGDVEILVILDGYWPPEMPSEDKRIRYLHFGRARGMRAGINAAAAIATGEYLLKTDAHCLFAEGFDQALQADYEDNWIVIPRRYSLDPDNWARREDKPPVDAMYYFYPWTHPEDLGLHGRQWDERRRERAGYLIDEDLSFQGSCWFMSRQHWERIGGMSEAGYETFMGEPQEIGLKTQLGPWAGKVMRNKKTWYAHLHKGKTFGRMYYFSSAERTRANAYSFDFWWRNRWEQRGQDIEWLLEQWMPMPGWPANWQELKRGEHA